MTEPTDHPEEAVPTEPETAASGEAPETVWMRGLWTLILFALFAIAETLVIVAAVLQFGWMLFAKRKNAFIAEFGASLGNWLAKTARFQAGAGEEKPFPWSRWS